MPPTANDRTSIIRLATQHGLDLIPETLTINEIGLDFRVAIATTHSGERWVLRIPRRADVMPRATAEGRLLQRVAPLLDVAVPDWRIQSSELIAYPLLPGEPGLSIGHDGALDWHLDVEDSTYTHSLGEFLAQLHSIEHRQVADTGIEIRTPDEVRQAIANNITRVSSELQVAASLLDRWNSWLADDGFWPATSALTHGEVYPGHLLVTDQKIVGVLDWTTAAIGDPAQDFAFHRVLVSDEAFAATVQQYIEHGGEVGPRFAEHCTELYSISPVNYGIYALTTGDPAHVRAAAAALNPEL